MLCRSAIVLNPPVRSALATGDNQLVFYGVLPADPFGHGNRVAMRLQLQAAQDIGQMAAKFARVNREAQISDKGLAKLCALFLRKKLATSA